MRIAEPRASSVSLRMLYVCESHGFVNLSWIATGEEGFTATHRGSVTPGKRNTKTFKLVQFDR